MKTLWRLLLRQLRQLRRLDSLFVRLFLLMWITLVASHAVAYFFSVPANSNASRLDVSRWPTLPSLPPGNPFAAGSNNPDGHVSGGPRPDRGPPGSPPDGPGSGPGFAGQRPPPPPQPMSNMPNPPASPAFGAAANGTSAPPLPSSVLWTDYALRLLVIGLGALLGARWLSAPMRRLSSAAGNLGLDKGQPQLLDEKSGTHEVRETARVFNHMALRLQQQFDARGLHMAALSHDLRTPLTRLRMRLEALLPEAASHKAVADIMEMNAMIEGTLAVLREQNDSSGARVVDVAAMLQALADDLAEQGQPVGLPDENLPQLPVLAHPAALKRILDNLVGNALRYGGAAQLGAVVQDGRVLVFVDDCGPGIAQAQMEQAFLPWTRLGNVRSGSGHGLGLAVARDLAERDGAHLSLHNRTGGGLRAQLSMPLA